VCVCVLLKRADEAIDRFTVARPTVNVPEGFEDYLLVKKNYDLIDDDKQHDNEQVMCRLFVLPSFIFYYFIDLCINSVV